MVGYDAVATAVGTFRLEAKIGVAAGAVLCTSVGDPATRLEYVVAGSAIDLCADAEHRAAPGDVVAHADLLHRCPGIELDWQEGDFARVTAIRPRPTGSRRGPLPRSPVVALPTLAAYLHPVIAERLLAGLGSFVDEHRRLTVLFVGFEGPDYSNRDAAVKLQAYLAPAVEIITRYDGHLRQVETGDKGSLYIVFFGAPVSHEDDEERALRAALELRELPGDRVTDRCRVRLDVLWLRRLARAAGVRRGRRHGQPRRPADAGRRAGGDPCRWSDRRTCAPGRAARPARAGCRQGQVPAGARGRPRGSGEAVARAWRAGVPTAHGGKGPGAGVVRRRARGGTYGCADASWPSPARRESASRGSRRSCFVPRKTEAYRRLRAHASRTGRRRSTFRGKRSGGRCSGSSPASRPVPPPSGRGSSATSRRSTPASCRGCRCWPPPCACRSLTTLSPGRSSPSFARSSSGRSLSTCSGAVPSRHHSYSCWRIATGSIHCRSSSSRRSGGQCPRSLSCSRSRTGRARPSDRPSAGRPACRM